MELSIIGREGALRDQLYAELRKCIGPDSSITLRQYGTSEPETHMDPPPESIGAFIVIDNAGAMSGVRRVQAWGEDFPVVLAATHPQYALEAIRLRVRHYILYPLEQKELRESLRRMGVISR